MPGFVPPEELGNGTRWLILGGVIAGTACLILEPCGAVALAAVEATGPPIAVVPSGAVAVTRGVVMIDDLPTSCHTRNENPSDQLDLINRTMDGIRIWH
jgi:hypothetical protein